MAKGNGILEDSNNGEDEDLLGEEAEVKEKEEEIIDLGDAVLVNEEGVEKEPEAASEEEREVAEDVLEKDSELKEKVFESAQWEVVSQYPSGQEEAGKETEEALGEESEPSIDLQEQIELDEELKEILSEEDTGKLKEPLSEETVEKEIPDKEEAAEEVFTEKENLIEENPRSLQITGAFIRFILTGEESLIEHFTREELEANLSKHQAEKGHPVYEVIEKRVVELREIERYKRETEEKWDDRTIGFISGLIAALIIVLLRKYLFSS